MSMFSAMNISASGLTAEKLRMDVISANIANANTTRTEEGGAYRRKVAVFQEQLTQTTQGQKKVGGIQAVSIVEDTSDMKMEYDPTHPDADENGYVEKPNVDILSETIDMMVATRSYEAQVTVLNATKGMYTKALEIGR